MTRKAFALAVVRVFEPVLRLILLCFFEKKYISGRFFSEKKMGYLWAFKSVYFNSILRLGQRLPWPMSFKSFVHNSENIVFDPDDINNFQSDGCYFQNFSAKIYLGKGVLIANNVGFITANHDLSRVQTHSAGSDIVIGDYCWIGMNSVILPGVRLARGTIVGAGSIVTKSFENGHCVLAGNPAKVVKQLCEAEASRGNEQS